MNLKPVYSILLLVALLFSCKDNQQVPSGDVNIHINVKHHLIAIPYCKVYVKNNTLEFPGKDSSLYDQMLVTDANGYLKISDVGNGDKKYVLYAKGIDPNWDTTQTTPVWGFQPVAISTKPGENKEKYVTIPVSE